MFPVKKNTQSTGPFNMSDGRVTMSTSFDISVTVWKVVMTVRSYNIAKFSF